ncbi:hypothetical protein KAH81_06875, partial [bacterium]|nr:hypothetical protein [bacterium]
MREFCLFAVVLIIATAFSSVEVEGEYATFTLFEPEAQNVFVVGDFNSWSDSESPMTQNDSGMWTKKINVI